MYQIQDPHWLNIVPDTGSLILPLVEGTDTPNLHGRQYKLTDGRLVTSGELERSPENVHRVPGATLRRRLNDLHLRDPADIFAPVAFTGRRASKALAAQRAEVAA